MSSHSVPVRRFSRTALVGLLVAATAVLTLGGMPTVAHAATVGDLASLQAALSPGTDPTVTLSADIYASTETVVIDRDVTLDLGSHAFMPGTLTINDGASLTLKADGSFQNRIAVLEVNGTLILGSDLLMQGFAEVMVGGAGRIDSDSTPRTMSGMYMIDNQGTITAAIDSTVRVTGNNYTIRFVDNLPGGSWTDVQVYAPTLAAAGIPLPTPTRTHAAVASWNHAQDGSDTELTEDTELSTIPGAWGAYFAQWVADGITSFSISYDGAPGAASAGGIGLYATDTTPGGDGGDITDLVDFASDVAADEVDGTLFAKYVWAELAGDRLMSGSVIGTPAVTSSIVMPVTHSEYIDEITLAMTPTTVVTGTTSSAYLSATDYFGNSFGYNLIGDASCDYCETTVTSSDPNDVIDPVTGVITFTTLGLHTITATVNMIESEPLVATATVNVVAAPVTPAAPAPPKTLSATGFAPSGAPFAAALLLLLGLGTVLLGRRRRTEAR